MNRHRGHLIISISMEDTPENQKALGTLKELAFKDGWSLSRLFREAAFEYAKRHSPGNPQLDMIHWQEDVPLPETLSHKHKYDRIANIDGAYRDFCKCGAQR